MGSQKIVWTLSIGLLLLAVAISAQRISPDDVRFEQPEGQIVENNTAYWKHKDFGEVRVRPAVVELGETITLNFTNLVGTEDTYNFGFLMNSNDLYLRTAKVDQVTEIIKNELVNASSFPFEHKNGSFEEIFVFNYTQYKVNLTTQVDITDQFQERNLGDGTVYFLPAKAVRSLESELLYVKISPKKFFGGEEKWSAVIWPSDTTLADSILLKKYIMLDPWIDTSTYIDHYDDNSDLSDQGDNNFIVVNGHLIGNPNMVTWDLFTDNEHTQDPYWANSTPADWTGETVNFNQDKVLNYTRTGSTGDGYQYFWSNSEENVTITQDEKGTSITIYAMTLDGPTRGPVVAARVDWDQMGTDENNPNTAGTGDTIYCLAGADQVLYFLESDEGSVTLLANPSLETSGNIWYNMTMTVNKTHGRCGITGSDTNQNTGWKAHDLSNMESARFMGGLYDNAAGAGWIALTNMSVYHGTQGAHADGNYATGQLNSSASIDKINLTFDFDYLDPAVSITACNVRESFNGARENITWGTHDNPVENDLVTDLTGLFLTCNFTGLGYQDYVYLNNTQIDIVAPVAGGDTCDYTSGDFIINCDESCTVDAAYDLGGNAWEITGAGVVTIDAQVENAASITIRGIGGTCEVIDNTGSTI